MELLIHIAHGIGDHIFLKGFFFKTDDHLVQSHFPCSVETVENGGFVSSGRDDSGQSPAVCQAFIAFKKE